MNQKTKIEISTTSVLKVLGILATLALVYIIRDILVIVFLSFIFYSAFLPLVNYSERKGVPRSVSVLGILIILILSLSIFIRTLTPTIFSQSARFIETLPLFTQESIKRLGIGDIINKDFAKDTTAQLATSVTDFFGSFTSTRNLLTLGNFVVNVFLNLITLVVLTLYLLLDKNRLRRIVLAFFKKEHHEKVNRIIGHSQSKMGIWMRGQLTVMIIIGTISYIGLRILDVEFALPLAIIAGLLEIIPILGPSLSAIPAIIIAATDSPAKALVVLLFYFIVQQLENAIVVPKVMNQAVGLDPVIIILAVMIGARLGGPLGALIAVPLVAISTIMYTEWVKEKRKGGSKPPSLPKS